MKSTLTLAAAVLSIILSIFTMASVKNLPMPPGPLSATPPAPPTDPALKSELSSLRQELSTLKACLAEAERTATVAASVLPVLSVPANPVREAMLADMETMWKASKGMSVKGAGPEHLTRGYLKMGADGPEVGEALAKTLDLQPVQAQAVNTALQSAYRDYLTLETAHLKQTKGEDGAVHVEIQAFAVDGKGLQDRLWSQLDCLLTPHQREVARLQMQRSLNELFLDFGVSKRTLTIAKGEFGFDYEEKYQNGNGSGSGSLLPPKFQRFWKE